MTWLEVNGITFETKLEDTEALEMLLDTVAENGDLTAENVEWLNTSCIPKMERIEELKADGRVLDVNDLYNSGINDYELDRHIELLENA